MFNEVFIPIVRQVAAKLICKVPHAVQAISLTSLPTAARKLLPNTTRR